jgi:hypothetical protein
LGTGSGFLDPATLKPYAAAEKLTFWRQRTMLTPVPLAEWGREEFTLAQSLQMPLGRATLSGLLGLGNLLGLEGAEDRRLVDPRGDELAQPLPEVFRVRPDRFLYDTPPSDRSVEQIIQDLRNVLDGPGFEWLCALAVYPAIQWDLTIYLGVTLPQVRGQDAAITPMYREDRLSSLTQLPWLREGLMPNWLRRALIKELSTQRAAEIRTALSRLIDRATPAGDKFIDDAVPFRISRDISKERFPPKQLFDDDVLLDFLARGQIEDLELRKPLWLDQFVPPGWLDRIGLLDLGGFAVAALYAAAAYLVAPKPWDGALVTGAWLPLIALALGSVVALAASNLAGTYRLGRRALTRAMTLGLAFAFALALYWTVDVALHAIKPIDKGSNVLAEIGGFAWLDFLFAVVPAVSSLVGSLWAR